jgi:hypothetical protein
MLSAAARPSFDCHSDSYNAPHSAHRARHTDLTRAHALQRLIRTRLCTLKLPSSLPDSSITGNADTFTHSSNHAMLLLTLAHTS